LEELRAEVLEFIFEEEMREAPAEEMADHPRWEDMLEVLRRHGVTANEATLASLPFVIELHDVVVEAMKG
jgi:hypothetical protein